MSEAGKVVRDLVPDPEYRPYKRFTEMPFYSATLDQDMIRLAAYDDHHQEFYCMIPDGYEKPDRLAKQHAMQAIEEAIDEARRKPGTVYPGPVFYRVVRDSNATI